MSSRKEDLGTRTRHLDMDLRFKNQDPREKRDAPNATRPRGPADFVCSPYFNNIELIVGGYYVIF